MLKINKLYQDRQNLKLSCPVLLIFGEFLMKKRGARFKTKRDPNSFNRVFRNKEDLDDQQKTVLGLAYREAFEEIKTGHGVESHFHTLACTANIAVVMCEGGLGADYMNVAIEAQDAIVRCYTQSKALGKYLLDGDGMNSISTLMNLHDAQLQIAKNGDLSKTVDEVYRRINARMPGHQVMELV